MELPARRDRVWWALTTEEGLSCWLCRRAEVQPYVGGSYELFLEEPAEQRLEPELRCQVLSIDHPRLLQLAWQGPEASAFETSFSEVRVQLFPTLDGTRLEITHDCTDPCYSWDEIRLSLERLWIDSLERLQLAVQQPI
jgi:uncharacterized protein YndB with AHSA1/START domain